MPRFQSTNDYIFTVNLRFSGFKSSTMQTSFCVVLKISTVPSCGRLCGSGRWPVCEKRRGEMQRGPGTASDAPRNEVVPARSTASFSQLMQSAELCVRRFPSRTTSTVTLSARILTEEGMQRHVMHKCNEYSSPNYMAITLNELKMKNRKPYETVYSDMLK